MRVCQPCRPCHRPCRPCPGALSSGWSSFRAWAAGLAAFGAAVRGRIDRQGPESPLPRSREFPRRARCLRRLEACRLRQRATARRRVSVCEPLAADSGTGRGEAGVLAGAVAGRGDRPSWLGAGSRRRAVVVRCRQRALSRFARGSAPGPSRMPGRSCRRVRPWRPWPANDSACATRRG